MGIAIGASVAGLCVGNGEGLIKVSQSVREAATKVKLGAQLAQGTFTAAGGGTHIVEGKYEKDAGYALADSRSASGQQELVSADIDEALERFSAAVQRQTSAAELTSNIAQQSSASNYAILNSWGGVA